MANVSCAWSGATLSTPLTQSALTTPNVELQLYGDGRNIVVATGTGPQLPRLFFGLCTGPCGFALREAGHAEPQRLGYR